MGREALQGLDLSQVLDLLNLVEVGLHALNGDLLPRLDRLGLEDL